MRKTALAAAGMIVSLAVFADNPKMLNVKTGQWEMTIDTATSGAPPIPEATLSKMTPEQRAKLEAMFASNAAPKTHKVMECVTKEDLEKPFHPDEDENCKTNVTRSTGTTQDITVVCTGERASTGHMHVEASSPESMKATMDLVMEGGKTPMQIKTKMIGRWLGPACKKDE